MTDELTIRLNETEYALSEDFKEAVEGRAQREFGENWLFDSYWVENERGDPVLTIETEGFYVPWDRLEQLEFEMQEVEQPDEDGSNDDETEEFDNGNGVKSVPKDDVDVDSPDPASPDEDDDASTDTKFMMTHPSKHYVPQPDDDDPDKLPPDPDELPEDPSLVAWVPESGRTEVWSTGKSLIPTSVTVEWNVQIRADEVPDGATQLSPDENNHVEEVPKTNNHDHWEALARMYDCEVVAEKQPSDSPPQSDETGYSGKEPEEELDGKYGGTNWDV